MFTAWVSRKQFDENQSYDREEHIFFCWNFIEWVIVAAITIVVVLGISLWISKVFLLMIIVSRLVNAFVV